MRRFFAFVLCSLLTVPAAFARAQDPADEEAVALPPEAMRHADEIERANGLIQGGQPAQAVEILRSIAEQDLAELGESNPFVVKAFSNLSYALSAAGEHAEARQTAYRALEIAKSQGEPSVSTAMVERNLAEIAERMGEMKEAQVWIENSCRDLEATYGRTPMAAETREIAARIAFTLGDLDSAQDHLERALAIHERYLGIANEATARPILPLAAILAQRGQLRTAVLLHQTARRVLDAAGVQGAPAWQDAIQGEVGLLVELGELALAREAASVLAGNAIQSEGAAEERFDALLHAAALYLNSGAGEPARALLERALGLVPELPASELAQDLRCLVPLARARLACKDAAGALEAIERALETEIDGLDPTLVAEMGLLRGRALLDLGRDEEARGVLLDTFQGLRGLTGAESPALREVLLALLRAEERTRGASVGLIDLVEMIEEPLQRTPPASLAGAARAAFERGETAFQGPLVQGLLRLAEKKPERIPETFAALERVRARSELAALAWRVESAEALEHPILGRHLAMLRAAEGAVPREGEDAAKIPELQASGSRFDSLLAGHGTTLEQARSLLESDAHVLIQYAWTDADAWALVVAHDAKHDALVHLSSCASLAPKLAQAQKAWRDLDTPCDLAPLAAELLHPVLAVIDGAQRVTLIADGPLAFVPFEALPLPSGEAWVERCAIASAPSVAELLALRAADRTGTKVAHVGPIVPHAEVTLSHEVLSLRGRFAVQPGDGDRPDIGVVLPAGETQLASERACESVLRDESSKGAFRGLRALEFQAPVYVDAEVASASGLVMTPESSEDGLPGWRHPNGFLDLGELAELDLAAELVLLPMAEVGPRADAAALRSDGLLALVSGFFRAGARAVALTSFTTPDNRARLFDASVLQYARTDAPAEAVRNAQRAWLAKARKSGDPKLAHPGVWARWRTFGS